MFKTKKSYNLYLILVKKPYFPELLNSGFNLKFNV